MGDEAISEPPAVPFQDAYWGPCWGLRVLPDGREIVLLPLGFGRIQLSVSRDRLGCFEDTWHYTELASAWVAFQRWDGRGEPPGWFRHPATSRRRPHGDPTQEYLQP